jgi:alpha-glucosidase
MTGPEPLDWRDAPDGVLAFARGRTSVWVNFGPDDVALPAGTRAVVRSGPGPDGVLPVDSAAWLVPVQGEDR